MNSEPTAERLRSIWAEVLDLPTVGDDDHFLELGGDSIAAVICVSRIHAEFDVEVPVALLFMDETTLCSLAAAIETAEEGATTPDVASV